MKQIFDRMSQDPDIRAIVLSSTGDKAFTSGLDVQAAAQGGVMNGGPTDAARVSMTFYHEAPRKLTRRSEQTTFDETFLRFKTA